MNLLRILTFALLIAFYIADLDRPLAGAADGPPTSITGTNKSDYTLDSPIGVAHLIARLNTDSILFRIDNALSNETDIGTQATLIGGLLKRFLHDHDHPPRLFVVFRDTSELWKRVRDTAVRSANWDAHSGRPRSGSVSAFIVQQINTNHLAHEFEDSFRAIGYTLKAKSVEQVVMEKAGPSRAAVVPVSGVFGFVAEEEASK